MEPGASWQLDEHRGGILLVDVVTTEAVYLDYHVNLSVAAGQAGELSMITLRIPAGTDLPSTLDAYVLLDVFPLYRQRLSG